MSTPAGLTYDRAGRIASDLTCAGCLHNLRGLLPSGNCTECGLPLRSTLCGSPLHAADPEWLRQVRSGVTIVCVLLLWIWLPYVWPIFAFGLWRLTTPEPRAGSASERALAHSVRGACTWGLSLLVFLLLLADVHGVYYFPLEIALRLTPDVIVCLVLTVCSLVLLLVALNLGRIGRTGKSKRVRTLATLAAVVSLLAAPSWAAWTLHALGVVDLNPWGWTTAAVGPPRIRGDLLAIAAATGGALLLPALGLTWAALVSAWRLLHVAEVQSRAMREEIKVWQRSVPGESYRQQAAASELPAAASGPPDPASAGRR